MVDTLSSRLAPLTAALPDTPSPNSNQNDTLSADAAPQNWEHLRKEGLSSNQGHDDFLGQLPKLPFLNQLPLPDWIDPGRPGTRQLQPYEGNGTAAQPYTLKQLLQDPQRITQGVHYFNVDGQPRQILNNDRTLSWAYLARSAVPALANVPVSELRGIFMQNREFNTFEFEAEASMYDHTGETASGRRVGTRYPSGRAGSALQWGIARMLAMEFHGTDNPTNEQVQDILRGENVRVDITLQNGRQAMLTMDDIGSLFEPYSIAAAREYREGFRSGQGSQYFRVEMTHNGIPRLVFNEGFRLLDIHESAVPGVQGVQRVSGRITLPNFSVSMVTQAAPEQMQPIASRYLHPYLDQLQRYAYEPR